MRLLRCLCVVLFIAPLAWADDDEAEYKQGLAAHYYRDQQHWGGQWPDGESKPFDQPVNHTFTNYRYTAVEPLVNHLFIRRGWFSVRWQGWIDLTREGQAFAADDGDDDGDDAGDDKPARADYRAVTYEIAVWADDGCRLWLDNELLIDSWIPCAEDSPQATRTITVRLQPGVYRLRVEYFQGQSLEDQDHDPIKLYWACEDWRFPRLIVPASRLAHRTSDLVAQPGRLDEPVTP